MDEKKPQYYRFNLNLPIEYKDYLQEMAWQSSSRKNIVTITEYVKNLIAADMEQHPNWRDSLDELND